MTTVDLKEELTKAQQTFSTWPAWKQTVLRNSMRGKVLTARVLCKQDSKTKAAKQSKAK